MKTRFLVVPIVQVIFLCQNAHAVTSLSEPLLNMFDLDQNGSIDEGTEENLLLDQLPNPVLLAYDVSPKNGKLDANEIANIVANKNPDLPPAMLQEDVDELAVDLQFGVSRKISFLAKPKVQPPKNEKDQRLFLRGDRINASVYEKNLGKAASEGAKVDISYDPGTGTSDVSLSGALSFVIRDIDPNNNTYVPGNSVISGYGVMPYLEFDWRKKSTATDPERSSLIGGVSVETVVYDGPLFGTQVIQLNPHYQTDFDFDARIYGAQASWQPYNVSIGLGSYIPVGLIPNVWQTWSATLDTDFRHIDSPGLTNFVAGEEHLWVGGNISTKFKIEPTKELENRLFATARIEYHHDVLNNREALLYGAGMIFNIDERGFTAITLDYERGEFYQTGKHTNDVNFGLGVKF